jgi:hypothetical protein
MIKYVAVIGLCFDITGVLLVAYYGFPSSFLEKKVVEWGYEKKDRVKQKILSWLGTALMVVGFLLQILNYL